MCQTRPRYGDLRGSSVENGSPSTVSKDDVYRNAFNCLPVARVLANTHIAKGAVFPFPLFRQPVVE